MTPATPGPTVKKQQQAPRLASQNYALYPVLKSHNYKSSVAGIRGHATDSAAEMPD